MLENADVIGYISKEAMILIPVLYVLGMFLKNVPKIPDWVIPSTILLVGIVISFLMFGVTVDAGIQGVLAAGASVFANQLYKQSMQKSQNDNYVSPLVDNVFIPEKEKEELKPEDLIG